MFAGVKPAAQITSRMMEANWSAWSRISYNPTYASKALQKSVKRGTELEVAKRRRKS